MRKQSLRKCQSLFQNIYFWIQGFLSSSKVFTKFSMMSPVDHISLRCHQMVFAVPKFCWVWFSKIRGSDVFFLCKSLPCSVSIIDFLCARSTGEQCGAVSGAQLGEGHQTLADGQSIVAVTKHLLTYLLFVSCCLSATSFREQLQKGPQTRG